MYAFTYLLGLIKWSGDCLTALLIRYSHRTAISWFNIRISIQDSPPQLNSVARSNLEYIHPYILHHLYSHLQSNLLLDRCFLRRDMYMCVLKPKTQSCLQLVVSSYFANYSDKTNKRRNLFDQTTNIWHVFFIISELSRIFSSFFALYSLTWKVFSCGLDVG